MKRISNLWSIALVVLLLVAATHPAEWLVWDERLVPEARGRQYRNPRRNRERWARRLARQERQHAQAARRERRRRRMRLLRALLRTVPAGQIRLPPTPQDRPQELQPAPVSMSQAAPSAAATPAMPGASQAAPSIAATPATPAASQAAPSIAAIPTMPAASPDPLADLRQMRGWIDQMDERQLWEILIRVRWPQGPACPRCGERDLCNLQSIEPDYRGGLGRWRCLVCALAGDGDDQSTFTPLTGTILEGTHLDIRTIWLIVECFADGKASVETADEARVHRHSSDRLFRLLRAAIYQSRSSAPIISVDDIGECDEVYITAGLKGEAGGLALEREPRQRGLKRRGRGDWESDRLPVFGLVCRGGEVRLCVLRNVQSETIRPIIHQLVQRGAKVYTDSYSIYHFLSTDGYQHRTVNHSAGEYALDLDGDGKCEVHCNTMECTWSWLRQMIRTYRGVSKVYLPLYVSQFEFLFNRRHKNHWQRTLDVLQTAFQINAASAADLLNRVESARLAEVCPVAG